MEYWLITSELTYQLSGAVNHTEVIDFHPVEAIRTWRECKENRVLLFALPITKEQHDSLSA